MKALSCLIVLFGSQGDLAKRLLIPALYNLASAGLLPKKFAVIGTSRRKMNTEEYRKQVQQVLQDREDQNAVSQFSQLFHYFPADADKEASYPSLKAFIEEIDRQFNTQQCFLFYLATPPDLFSTIPAFLSSSGLLKEEGGWRRVVFEKPFGNDLESAKELNSALLKVMSEDQIFRIDHYLGKETVQNILILRFANGVFEPIWNHRYIKSVQITVAETLGVEDRASYYEKAGALRDMVPNHLFQLVALIAMEPPNSLSANDIRSEKAKAIRAIKPFSKLNQGLQVVRGQYGPGILNGTELTAYRDEPHVNPDSRTETFVAMKLELENWRWAGVPFYLRTGKRMARRLTEVIIEFKKAPFHMFRGTPCEEIFSNLLILQIQPEEKISLAVSAKVPGPSICLGKVIMDLNYRTTFGASPKTGYETLLLDVMKGDETLFQRADQIEAAWKVVDPILKDWKQGDQDGFLGFPIYPAGGWGPPVAFELLERDHMNWYLSSTPQLLETLPKEILPPKKEAA